MSAGPSPAISRRTSSVPAPPPASSATVVSYGQRTAKVRIDAGVPLSEVLRQLCGSSQLGIAGSDPEHFCLRDEAGDELVTAANFAKKLRDGARFKLVSSPIKEAREMVERLKSADQAGLKHATWALRAFVKEPDFIEEFIRQDGVHELTRVIEHATGNTLAYALASLHSLMETAFVLSSFDDHFLEKLVRIVSEQSLTNIVRPATAILRNILISESPLPADADTSDSAPNGFLRLWLIAREDSGFLSTVVGRLAAGDKLLVQASLALLNALARPAIELGVEDYLEAVIKLDLQAAVLRLAETSPSDDLVPFLLEFQAVVVSMCRADHRPLSEGKETAMLEQLTEKAQADLAALGIDRHDLNGSFGDSGVLALKTLLGFASRKGDLKKILLDQHARPEDRACSISRASSEVLEELAERLGFLSAEPTEMHELDYLLLAWPQVHALGLKMFFRFWLDSQAASSEFARIAQLVRGQIRSAVAGKADSTEAMHEVERLLLTTQYRSARDRHSKDLEIEDELLTKAPIRSLRARLYNESFEFVRNQRIQCMIDGAWMLHWAGERRTPVMRTWRFYRLATNHRYLHFVERETRHVVRSGIEDLPERIDLELISDIVPHPQQSKLHHRGHSSTTAQSIEQQDTHLRFSLISGEKLIADLQAPDEHAYAEWLDGLSMLRQNGRIQTQETANLIQTLTEINVKVKLLDISGERVEIPASCPVAAVPLSEDFVYL